MNIKEKLKNPANKNMIFMISISVILVIFALIFFIGYIYENLDLNKYYNNGTITYELGKLINDIALLLGVILPLIISGITVLFGLKSKKIIFSENPKRLKKYKNILYVGYCFMLISCLFYSYMAAAISREVIVTILVVLFYLWVIAVVIIGIINTKKCRLGVVYIY